MMHWGYYYNGPWMILRMIIMIVFCVAIIFAIVSLIKRTSYAPTQQTESPLRILKLRYAKGEITKDEFDEMKQELNEKNNP